MEMSDQLHAPAALPQGPLDRRLGGPQSGSGRFGEEKHLLPLTGIQPRPFQLVASRYTDWAMPAPPGCIVITIIILYWAIYIVQDLK
jgi:hypothetical protein